MFLHMQFGGVHWFLGFDVKILREWWWFEVVRSSWTMGVFLQIIHNSLRQIFFDISNHVSLEFWWHAGWGSLSDWVGVRVAYTTQIHRHNLRSSLTWLNNWLLIERKLRLLINSIERTFRIVWNNIWISVWLRWVWWLFLWLLDPVWRRERSTPHKSPLRMKLWQIVLANDWPLNGTFWWWVHRRSILWFPFSIQFLAIWVRWLTVRFYFVLGIVFPLWFLFRE